MARHRIGVLDRRGALAATTRLEEEQARVRRRIEEFERVGNRSFLLDEASIYGENAGDSSVTERSEATDEDVAAAIRALEAHDRLIR